MDHEPVFLAHLRRVIPHHSVVEQAILRQFLFSLYDEQFYVVGALVGDEGLDIFRQDNRKIVALFHVAHERSNKRVAPIAVLVSHPVLLVEGEWEMLTTTVTGCYHELLSAVRLPSEGICLPPGVRATVLMTVLPPDDPADSPLNEVEFVFMFDRKLSPYEGMHLLFQGMNLWRDQNVSTMLFAQPRIQ